MIAFYSLRNVVSLHKLKTCDLSFISANQRIILHKVFSNQSPLFDLLLFPWWVEQLKAMSLWEINNGV